MTRRQWWWVGMVGILMIVGALEGCSGGDSVVIHDDGLPTNGLPTSRGCVLVGEQEPNATALTAQFLGALFVGDCVGVAGSLLDPVDVDSYKVLVQQTLTLVVTLDHSPRVDFDLDIFDADTGQLISACGSSAVPEVCVVPFVVRSRDIAVDVVVTSVIGAGTYTLTISAQ